MHRSRCYRVLTMVYNTQRSKRSKGPNRVGVFPHLRTETDPVSETLCFSLLFRKNPDDGQVRKPNISMHRSFLHNSV
jgi:hypothetical protein